MRRIVIVLSAVRCPLQVRHEAAEAIGSIAGADCRPLLQQYAKDADPVVAQGCEVALDIMDYELSGDFEYCAV